MKRHPFAVGLTGLLVLAVLLGLAFQFDAIKGLTARSYRAAFHDASGLAPGNEVRVAGVRVGKVTGIDLARGPSGMTAGTTAAVYVRVAFRLDDDGVKLGRETGATIRIKTVLGQKYLALAPAGAGTLPEDAEIPLSRTATPFDVVEAVSGLAGTLDQIDSEQLAQAFRTLSATFQNTPPAVDASLRGLSRLSETVASRDRELRELLTRARSVTGVLADRDEEFRKLVADGEALLTEVSRRRDAIHDLLVGTDELARQLSGLVRDNRAQLAPALARLRGAVAILQRNKDNLENTIQRMGPFVAAFANVTGNGRWFDSYVRGLLQPYQPTGGR